MKELRFHSSTHEPLPACHSDHHPFCQNLDERRETSKSLQVFDGGHLFPDGAIRNNLTNSAGTGSIPIDSNSYFSNRKSKSPGERVPVATITSASSSSEFSHQSDNIRKQPDQKPSNVLSGANFQGDFHAPPGSRETVSPPRSGTFHNWQHLDNKSVVLTRLRSARCD